MRRLIASPPSAIVGPFPRATAQVELDGHNPSTTEMTPTKDSAAAARPDETQPSFEDALADVDTSVLDRLIELRAEQSRIEDYLSKADSLQEKVSKVVWQRVISDYKARARAIDVEAAPLRLDAQREYRKLHALRSRVDAAERDATLAKEELELRQAVGELDDDEFREKLAAPEEALAKCRQDIETIELEKARFIEAFGSEEKLAQPQPEAETRTKGQTGARAKAGDEAAADEPAPATAETPASPQAADVPADSSPAVDADDDPGVTIARMRPAAPPAASEPPSADAESDEPDRTIVVRRQPGRTGSRAKASAEAPAQPATSGGGEGDDRTFVLPAAALLLSIGDAEPTVHRLSAITYMGRLDDNQLQIARSGVSRRHALIEGTPDGFRLKDLGSQNGTFCNGERVSERVLVDGDRIVIGDAKLVFQSPWPKPGDSGQGA